MSKISACTQSLIDYCTSKWKWLRKMLSEGSGLPWTCRRRSSRSCQFDSAIRWLPTCRLHHTAEGLRSRPFRCSSYRRWSQWSRTEALKQFKMRSENFSCWKQRWNWDQNLKITFVILTSLSRVDFHFRFAVALVSGQPPGEEGEQNRGL